MKKTFPVNINGKVYYIDEDAYALLQNYLSQLRATFPGEEGIEIVNDIECRISELFDERMTGGMAVIVMADVNYVIETMGRPEDLGEVPGPEAHGTDASGASDGQGPVPPPFYNAVPDSAEDARPHRKLYRDERHKVFGGVLAGLGQYLNWDVTILRVLVVILALATKLIPCIILYLIAWLVIPPARTSRQILEMQGQPVNLSTVGHNVIDSATPPPAPVPGGNDFAKFINTCFSLVAKFFLALFAFAGGVAAFACGVIALVVIAGMICVALGYSVEFISDYAFGYRSPFIWGWGMALLMLAIALPAGALLWAGCTVLFKAPSISRSAVVVGLIIEVLLIVGCAVLINLDVPEPFTCMWGILPPTAMLSPSMC